MKKIVFAFFTVIFLISCKKNNSTQKEDEILKTISVKSKYMPKTIKKLKSGKTYFVKIRKYQKPGYDGYTFDVYGKWSKTFKVKVK